MYVALHNWRTTLLPAVSMLGEKFPICHVTAYCFLVGKAEIHRQRDHFIWIESIRGAGLLRVLGLLNIDTPYKLLIKGLLEHKWYGP